MIDDYNDIIDFNYQGSTRNNKMTNYQRAGQFAPFSALKGYDEAILEISRITDLKREIDNNYLSLFDELLKIIMIHNQKILLEIRYFVKDKSKEGGNYQVIRGYINKVDVFLRIIKINNNIIKFDDIVDIMVI